MVDERGDEENGDRGYTLREEGTTVNENQAGYETPLADRPQGRDYCQLHLEGLRRDMKHPGICS